MKPWGIQRECSTAPLEELERAGINPYPHRFQRTHTAAQIHQAFGRLKSGEECVERVRTAGRVMALRRHGGILFLDLQDLSGRIQGCVRKDLHAEAYRLVEQHVNRGDLLGLAGPVFRTRMGELTVLAEEVVFLAKCLRPLPDKFHGLHDAALMRERRYLHLMVDPEATRRFLLRSRIVKLIREFLYQRGFVEVETAILDTVYGGAEARPFTTRYHALDRDLFLRISPELPLKRLIIGGLEKVFEIGKQFRNEGIDARHHPEFTSIEVYQAYADYHDMMALTEQLLYYLAIHILGSPRVVSRVHGNGEAVEVDLTPPFNRLTVLEAIKTYTGADFSQAEDEEARAIAQKMGVEISPKAAAHEVIMAVFEEKVERCLLRPTFVMDYPAPLCPLAKRHRADPRLAERFELYIHGLEFANAYSELNDPREQQRHFQAQAQKRAQGDEVAHLPDWEFVEALHYGMPPTGGLGIGIDRLVMLLTGASHIQDVILFPLRGGFQGHVQY
jgi:lysyl-tRNA synthetase, class II